MINKLLQNAFQSAAIGMALLSLKGRWLRVNGALCELLGFLETDILTRTFQEMTPAEDLDSNREPAQQLLSGQIEGYQATQRMYRKDGSIIWVSLNVSLVRNSAGEAECFFAQFQDVTSRREAEDIREKLFELPVALHFIAGFDGYFKKLSTGWPTLLGYPMEYLLAVPYLDFVHPDDRVGTIGEADGLTKGRSVFLFENRYRHADGTYRWLFWTTISDRERKLVYGVALDYTARKETELELVQTAEEMKGLVQELSASQEEILKLREGLVTVCAWTKRVLHDGQWIAADDFLRDHLHLKLTHGICDEAFDQAVAELDDVVGHMMKETPDSSPQKPGNP